jgi:hypothetical protein
MRPVLNGCGGGFGTVSLVSTDTVALRYGAVPGVMFVTASKADLSTAQKGCFASSYVRESEGL